MLSVGLPRLRLLLYKASLPSSKRRERASNKKPTERSNQLLVLAATSLLLLRPAPGRAWGNGLSIPAGDTD